MIKKSILLLVCVVLTATVLNAQDNRNRVGIKGGYNLAGVSFDDDSDTDTNFRSGFHIGVFGEVSLNKFISLQPELLYSQQGFEIENNSGTLTQRIDYLNFPLMLKLYPLRAFYLEAGPQIGFAINDDADFDSNFDLFDGTTEFDPDNVDYGINVGAGFNISKNFQIGGRFHFGLGDIYDEGAPNNRVFSLSALLSF